MFRVITVEIFCLLFICFGIASGSKCYSAEFSDDVWPCPDYDNKVLQCNPLQVGMVEGKEADLGLNGKINVTEPIDEGSEMVVEIFKMLDVGQEFMYRIQGDICGSLKDKDTPWYPMVESMKITKCPIEPKIYSIKDMTMNLNSSKDVMTHEMCGDYKIQLQIIKELEVSLSCWELAVTLLEYDCN